MHFLQKNLQMYYGFPSPPPPSPLPPLSTLNIWQQNLRLEALLIWNRDTQLHTVMKIVIHNLKTFIYTKDPENFKVIFHCRVDHWVAFQLQIFLKQLMGMGVNGFTCKFCHVKLSFFMTSCMLYCKSGPFWNGTTQKGTNLVTILLLNFMKRYDILM